MLCNGLEQVSIQLLAVRESAISLAGNHGLKGFESLKRCLEADGSWGNGMLDGGLGHDGADQVVSQHMRPNLLPNELGSFAAQDVHLQGDLDRPEIKFIVPSLAIQQRQILCGGLFGIEQCRHDDNDLGPESRLLHPNPSFSNREELRQ